jgi:hypothetical protein
MVAAVSWWLWVLIWALLCLGALAFMFLLLRQLWRKVRLLFAELGTATDRLSAVTDELERLDQRVQANPDPAVFDNPGELRAERFVTRGRRSGSQHRLQK